MSQSVSISPCINICTLDNSGMCIGCGRTLEEIAAWSRMTPMQRHESCNLAKQRLHQRAAAQSSTTAPDS
ncbi:MAG TPA: DUF1289 domain-containing protein [Xanthomonadales bacterium]|nr:DUF1289 domain-containing protein [Xanthomonadales bacterium]